MADHKSKNTTASKRVTKRSALPSARTFRNGFCDNVAHDFLKLMARKGSGNGHTAVWTYIWEHTYGAFDPKHPHAPKQEWCKVPLRPVAKENDLDPKTIELALGNSVERALLLVEKRGRDNWYNLVACIDDWESIPNYKVWLAEKLAKEKAEAEATAAAEAAAAEAAGEPAQKSIHSGDQMILLPGKNNTVPLRFIVAGLPDPVNMQFQCTNESGMPLCITHRPDGSKLRVVVRLQSASGEERAKVSANLATKARSTLRGSANGFTDSNQVANSRTRTIAYREYFDTLVLRGVFDPLDWSNSEDRALFERFLSSTTGAPVKFFQMKAEERLSTKRLKPGQRHSPGFLEHLGAACGKKWRAEEARDALQQPRDMPPSLPDADADERWLAHVRMVLHENHPEEVNRLRMDFPADVALVEHQKTGGASA